MLNVIDIGKKKWYHKGVGWWGIYRLSLYSLYQGVAEDTPVLTYNSQTDRKGLGATRGVAPFCARVTLAIQIRRLKRLKGGIYHPRI